MNNVQNMRSTELRTNVQNTGYAYKLLWEPITFFIDVIIYCSSNE